MDLHSLIRITWIWGESGREDEQNSNCSISTYKNIDQCRSFDNYKFQLLHAGPTINWNDDQISPNKNK